MVGSLLRSKDCSGIFGKDATESFQKTFLVPALSWNLSLMVNKECYLLDFLGGPVLKNLSANTGTRVCSLIWEDSTSLGAAKPTQRSC